MTRIMMILGGILLLTAALLWLALVVTAADINGSDAAGNGMSYGFGSIMAVALWALLGVLLVLSGGGGAVPAWVKAAGVVLLPLSLAAALATINLLYRRPASVSGWPIITLVLVPPLLMSYAVWAALPGVRAFVPAMPVSRTVWGAVLLFSLLPWPMLRTKRRREAAMQATYVAQGQATADSAAAALEAQFQSLTAETPLVEWLAFATAGNDLRERTLAGIRQLPGRQAEAEALRGPQLAMLMYELRNVDLTATPALCASTREFLLAHAASFRAKAAVTARYEIEASAVETYLFAMQWLAQHDCDLTPVLDVYDDVVHRFPPAVDREQFLARLVALRPATP